MAQPVDGPPRRHPGDVHDDVHARVLGVNLVGERGDLVIVGDVQRPVLGDLCTQRASIGHRLRQTIGVTVGQVQLGALAREP